MQNLNDTYGPPRGSGPRFAAWDIDRALLPASLAYTLQTSLNALAQLQLSAGLRCTAKTFLYFLHPPYKSFHNRCVLLETLVLFVSGTYVERASGTIVSIGSESLIIRVGELLKRP